MCCVDVSTLSSWLRPLLSHNTTLYLKCRQTDCMIKVSGGGWWLPDLLLPPSPSSPAPHLPSWTHPIFVVPSVRFLIGASVNQLTPVFTVVRLTLVCLEACVSICPGLCPLGGFWAHCLPSSGALFWRCSLTAFLSWEHVSTPQLLYSSKCHCSQVPS